MTKYRLDSAGDDVDTADGWHNAMVASGVVRISRRTALRGVAAAGIAGSGLLSVGTGPVGAANGGGPVVLMGIDAEDGGPGGHGPIGVYVDVVTDILTNVTNGGSGILVIGANGINPIAFWNAIASGTGQSVTYVTGSTDIGSEDFAGYAMIGVASSAPETFGGLTQLENDALVTRAADLAAFVNGGGGLLGFSQTNFTNAWDYLGSIGAVTTVAGLNYDNIDPTSAGTAIGITDDLDVFAWHDTFTEWPEFLDVLAWRSGFADVQAAALGGAQVVIEVDVNLSITGAQDVCTGRVEEYDVRLWNIGDETPENVQVTFSITRTGGIADSDVTLEYYDETDEEWTPLPLTEDAGALVGTFGPASGFPVPEAYDDTTRVRATFAVVDEYAVEADVVGVGTEEGRYAMASHTIVAEACCESCEAPNALAKYEFECVETNDADECIAWDFVLEGDGDDHIAYTPGSFDSKPGQDGEPMAATFETDYCNLSVLVKSGQEFEVQTATNLDGTVTAETANDDKFAISFIEFYCDEEVAVDAMEAFPSFGRGGRGGVGRGRSKGR